MSINFGKMVFFVKYKEDWNLSHQIQNEVTNCFKQPNENTELNGFFLNRNRTKFE